MQWQIVGSTTHRIIMHFDNILIKVYFIFRTIRNETDGKCCVIKMCCIMRKCTKLFALHAFAMQFIYNTICAHWMCNPTLSNHFMYSFRHLPFILYFIFSSSGDGVALIYFPFCRHPHSMRFGEVSFGWYDGTAFINYKILPHIIHIVNVLHMCVCEFRCGDGFLVRVCALHNTKILYCATRNGCVCACFVFCIYHGS